MTIEPIKGTKTGKNLCKHQIYITENEPTMKQEINRSAYYKQIFCVGVCKVFLC